MPRLSRPSFIRSHSHGTNAKKAIEALEPRRLLTAQPTFANFSSTTGLIANGFSGQAVTNGSALTLTNLSDHEARSVWWSKAVPIDTFTTHFSFNTSNSLTSADGLTFTIQNAGTSKVGGSGANLGYTGIKRSVAVAFNIYNGSLYGSQFGFAKGGVKPNTNADMSPADLHNGDTYNASVTYDGTTLAITLVDSVDPSKKFTTSEPINLPAAVGGDTAIVGFTAATGDEYSPQAITRWNFRGSNSPTVVSPAASSSAIVHSTSVGLTALGGDPHGESALTYTWSLVKQPPGALPIKFTANGTNGAKSIHATFNKAGKYVFRCTIKNKLGLTTTTDVPVTVRAVAQAVRLIPHIRIVHSGDHVNFKGTVVDQFDHAIDVQPSIRYSIVEGSGRVNQITGHYEAPNATGHLVVAASGDGLTGTVGGTLVH